MLSAGDPKCHWIRPGQRVNLPNGTSVTVQEGDTLGKIAQQHGENAGRLCSINPHLRNNPPPNPKLPTISIFREKISTETHSKRAELMAESRFPIDSRLRTLLLNYMKGEKLNKSEVAELMSKLVFPNHPRACELYMKYEMGQLWNFNEYFEFVNYMATLADWQIIESVEYYRNNIAR